MTTERFAPYYEAREIITEILEKDLIGPVEQDEWLQARPSRYYSAGKLYPQQLLHEEPDETESNLFDDNLVEDDSSLSLAGQFRPSSMALTFCLDESATGFRLQGTYARYLPFASKDVPSAWQHILPADDAKRRARKYWKRQPHSFDLTIPVQDYGTVHLKPIENEDLSLQVHFRRSHGMEGIIVTCALVNEATSFSLNDALCVFQPELRVSCLKHQSFRELKPASGKRRLDAQEQELLYGSHPTYANGHGCSAEWEPDTDAPAWIITRFMPFQDVRQMEPSGSGGPVLAMDYLAHSEPAEVLASLEAFRDAYGYWVQDLKKRADLDRRGLDEAAVMHVSACEAALSRITNGISLLARSLAEDGKVFRAFQLANEAMLMQRERTVVRSGVDFVVSSARWYPFQLAFLLYEISSFADPQLTTDGIAADRNVVDLLWFPTGGGKTEAYLGISAFAIFLRRLREPEADGVTVMMRYTMRLLTLQQFERASMMICACELLRRRYALGGSEISIGLWVGDSLSPNKLTDARAALNKPPGAPRDNGDPMQLRVCPWCGAPLKISDYKVIVRNTRMYIHCPNPACAFHESADGLPVHLIDEAIYFHLPTFIVATIDKFAQMPIREEPARLFGVQMDHKPPELIIQDELHLISGQLGTIAGLYEVAVSRACETDDGFGAKVIASTATIRGAASQVLSLFGRSLTQFPPPGLDADDLYFAAPARPEDRPSRRYLGIMGAGETNTTVLIRVFAALLFATRYLATLSYSDEVVDSFWTLTGYFNTLRELGQSASQIMDEVQERFRYLASSKFAHRYPGVKNCNYDHLQELTSRMDSTDVANVLQHGLLRSYKAGEPNKDVYDFVVATNMISVGVDVARLGAMLVAGQPKSSAEYIQATSRIGRSTPGLVISIYYPSRSRDRSHYEQFQTYHSTLYRHVEPVSLTPFSDRARDRALHTLFVTLCRYADPELLGMKNAGRFDSDDPVVREVIDYILDYVGRTDPDELPGLEEELLSIAQHWQDRAMEAETLPYVDYFRPENGLLNTQHHGDRFYAMNSMRNVDVDVGIYIFKGSSYA